MKKYLRISTIFVSIVSVSLLSLSTIALPQSKKQIRVWVVGPQPEGRQAYKDVVKKFEQKYPDVDVQLEIQSWQGYMEKQMTAFAGGMAPDLQQCGASWPGPFAIREMSLPLDEYVREWGELGDFYDVTVKFGTYKGQIMFIPYTLDQRALFYRKDFFREAGLDPNKSPENWDELLEYALKLTKRKNGRIVRSGLNVGATWAAEIGMDWDNYFMQAGGKWISNDLRKILADSPEGVEALQFYCDLANKYKVSPRAGMPAQGGMPPVVVGTAAIQYYSTPAMRQMKEYNPEDYENLGVAIPPKKKVRKTVCYVNTWTITRTTKYPDAAWKWIAFVMSKETMARISRANSYMPPRKSLRNVSPWSEDPRWKTIYDCVEIAVPYRVGKIPNPWEAIDTTVSKGLSDALWQKKTPEKALHEAVAEANQLLQEAYGKYE